MNTEKFWKLIAETHEVANSEPNQQAKLLIKELAGLMPDDIIEFQQLCNELMNRAYIADLWDAAHVIGGGCGDDGFMDFRAWLIQQGKTIYEIALKNPEILADIVEDGLETQDGGLWFVASKAYQLKTGQEMPKLPRHHPKLDKPLREESEKYLAYPKLAAKFPRAQF